MEKLSVKDAMQRLDVAETTIRRMIKRGDLPNTEKVDRKLWIPLSDIEAYEQRQASATSESSSESDTTTKPSTPAAQAEPERTPKPEKASAPPAAVASEVEEAEIIAEAEPEPLSGETSPAAETPPEDFSMSSSSPESQPSSEPVPYSSGPIQPTGEQEQSFKWMAVQAGILSTKWLEEIFHSVRVALEKYKKKAFPNADEK